MVLCESYTEKPPAGERVRLVITDMADWSVRVDVQTPSEREFTVEIFIPVKRSLPIMLIDCRPAVGQPKLGVAISTVFDEVPVFAVRDKAVADSSERETGGWIGLNEKTCLISVSRSS